MQRHLHEPVHRCGFAGLQEEYPTPPPPFLQLVASTTGQRSAREVPPASSAALPVRHTTSTERHLTCFVLTASPAQNLSQAKREAEAIDMAKKKRQVDKKKEVYVKRQAEEWNRIVESQVPFLFWRPMRRSLIFFRAFVGAQKGRGNRDVQDMLAKMAGRLRHEEIVPVTLLACNVTWMTTFLAVLGHQVWSRCPSASPIHTPSPFRSRVVGRKTRCTVCSNSNSSSLKLLPPL